MQDNGEALRQTSVARYGAEPVGSDGDSDGDSDSRVDADLRLVERFKANDASAFDELVRRYQKPIYYMALRYVKNEADAADITQRAFVRAYRGLGGFRAESALKTWLMRIAINLSLNHVRDHSRHRLTDIDDMAAHGRDSALGTNPTGANRIIRTEESAALRDAIEGLPPKQRMVLELRVYQELSFREVAELVGSSENAAKVNFHHAVKRLRDVMTRADKAVGNGHDKAVGNADDNAAGNADDKMKNHAGADARRRNKETAP